VKALLSREGVPFTAYNVDEDDRAYDDLIACGFRTVPVTVFGDGIDIVVTGFDEPALTAAIADWRAQS
jgi:glutaredoxin